MRLDLVVADAVERRRLTAGGVEFELDREPSPVAGRRAPAGARGLKPARQRGQVEPARRRRSRSGSRTASSRSATTAPGSRPRTSPHVFDRFYRSAAARGLPGSGLGLAIVRQVAEAHGGSAEACVAGQGGGTLIRLRIPVAPAAGSREREPVLN